LNHLSLIFQLEHHCLITHCLINPQLCPFL
jgi:hypothetical protein